MPISENSRVAIALGTGNVSTFSYSFRILAETDLEVRLFDQSDSFSDAALNLNADYTVAGVGDDAGGTITLTGGNLADGDILVISGKTPVSNSSNFRNASTFHGRAHEDAFDRATIIAQQQEEKLGRALKLPESLSGEIDFRLPHKSVADRKSRTFALDSNGTAVEWGPTAAEITGAAAAAATATAALANIDNIFKNVSDYGTLVSNASFVHSEARNNRIAIQACLDTSGVVSAYIPPGTYWIDHPINNASADQILWSEGKGKCKIRVHRSHCETGASASISAATQADPVRVTATSHGMSTGDHVTISGVVGMTDLNGNTYSIVKVDADNFDLQTTSGADVDGTGYGSYSSGGVVTRGGGVSTISTITRAEPPVVTTSSAHGLSEDDLVTFETTAAGMTEVDGNFYRATNVTSTTFELETTAGVDVDASGYTPYTSGGTVWKVNNWGQEWAFTPSLTIDRGVLNWKCDSISQLSALSADFDSATDRMTFSSAHGLSAGDLVCIYDPTFLMYVTGATGAFTVGETITATAIPAKSANIVEATRTNPVKIATDSDHSFVRGDVVGMSSMGGMTDLNGSDYRCINPLTQGSAKTITAITVATPPVVTTSTDHGLKTGEIVTFETTGAGTVEVDGLYFTVTSLSNTTFSLQDEDGTDTNGSGYTPYTSGGTVWRAPQFEIQSTGGTDVDGTGFSSEYTSGGSADVDAYATTGTTATVEEVDIDTVTGEGTVRFTKLTTGETDTARARAGFAPQKSAVTDVRNYGVYPMQQRERITGGTSGVTAESEMVGGSYIMSRNYYHDGDFFRVVEVESTTAVRLYGTTERTKWDKDFCEVWKITNASRGGVKGITIQGPVNSTSTALTSEAFPNAVEVFGGDGFVHDDVEIEGFKNAGFECILSYNTIYNKIKCDQNLEYDAQSGGNYGISIENSSGTTVSDSHINAMRHPITTGGFAHSAGIPNIKCSYTKVAVNMLALQGLNGGTWGPHGNSFGDVIIGNTLFGGVLLNGGTQTIVANLICANEDADGSSNGTSAVYSGGEWADYNHLICSNTMIGPITQNNNSVGFIFIYNGQLKGVTHRNEGYVRVINNSIRLKADPAGTYKAVVIKAQNAGGQEFKLVVANNDIWTPPASAQYWFQVWNSDPTSKGPISELVLRNNDIYGGSTWMTAESIDRAIVEWNRIDAGYESAINWNQLYVTAAKSIACNHNTLRNLKFGGINVTVDEHNQEAPVEIFHNRIYDWQGGANNLAGAKHNCAIAIVAGGQKTMPHPALLRWNITGKLGTISGATSEPQAIVRVESANVWSEKNYFDFSISTAYGSWSDYISEATVSGSSTGSTFWEGGKVEVVGDGTTHSDVDVANLDSLDIDCSGGVATIDGCKNGIPGQKLFISRLDSAANNAVIKHNAGSSDQKFWLTAEADLTMANHGGLTVKYDGESGYWREVGH